MTAATPASISSPLDPTFVAHEQVKQDAARHILSLPLTMLAMGALARGTLGVRDLLTPAHLPRAAVRTKQIRMPMMEEKLGEAPQLGPEGYLQTAPPPNANFLQRAINPGVDFLYRTLLASKPGEQAVDSLKKFWQGNAASTVWGVPATALAIPAGMAAAGVGYGGVDKLLDMHQDAQRKRELRDLQHQFHSAIKTASIVDQFQALAEFSTKEAVTQLGQTLGKGLGYMRDVAQDAWNSIPGDNSPLVPDNIQRAVADTAGASAATFAGPQSALALALALASGKLSYDHFRDRSRQKTLAEALRRRAGSRNQTELSPAYVVPLE
jgi:hypothetical protein